MLHKIYFSDLFRSPASFAEPGTRRTIQKYLGCDIMLYIFTLMYDVI